MAEIATAATAALTLIFDITKSLIGFARDGLNEHAALAQRLTRLCTYCRLIHPEIIQQFKSRDNRKAIRCLALFQGTAEYLTSLFPSEEEKRKKDLSRLKNDLPKIIEELDKQWKELTEACESLPSTPGGQGHLGVPLGSSHAKHTDTPAPIGEDAVTARLSKQDQEWKKNN